MSFLRTILSRVRREQDGAALVVAIGTLMVAGTLTAVALTTTMQVSGSSVKDGDNKRAIAAAEAGISVALYRFNQVATTAPTASFSDNCITDREVVWSAATQCPSVTGQLGNGATYQYWVTPSLDSTQTGIAAVRTACGTGTPGERCITAVGTVNGVSRRIQVRAMAESPFLLRGIVGLKKLTIDSAQNWSGSNFGIRSDLGTNGPLLIGNNANAPASPWQCLLGPAGTLGYGQNSSGSCAVVRLPQPLTAMPVDRLPFAATAASNANSTISAGMGYSSTNRMLTVPGNANLVLGSGSSGAAPADYSFCSLQMANLARISVPTGGRVRIFIDSPARTGSGCPGGSGVVNANNTKAILNPSPGGQLEIYVYGTSVPSPAGAPSPPATCGADFTYKNGLTGTAQSALYVYAPNSIVDITNDSPLAGAITGCEVKLWSLSSNSSYDYLGPPSAIVSRAAQIKGSWRECVAPTPVSAGVPQPYGTCKG